MPLFGHKNKQATNVNDDAGFPSAGNPGHQGIHSGAGLAASQNPNYAANPAGNLSGPGMNNRGYDDANYGRGAGNNNMAGPGRGAVSGAGPGNLSHQQQPQQQPHQQQGYDGDYGNTNQGIPPSGVINHNNSQTGGGGRTSGKIEHAIGTMIGSSSLKAKGLQKEQEANAMKLQGSEIAEAERLEREATMRRERAVAHGAHPDNRHLGASALNPSNDGGPGNTNYGARGRGGTGY